MRIAKRVALALALVPFFTLALVACGEKTDSGETPAETPAEAPAEGG